MAIRPNWNSCLAHTHYCGEQSDIWKTNKVYSLFSVALLEALVMYQTLYQGLYSELFSPLAEAQPNKPEGNLTCITWFIRNGGPAGKEPNVCLVKTKGAKRKFIYRVWLMEVFRSYKTFTGKCWLTLSSSQHRDSGTVLYWRRTVLQVNKSLFVE